ncbi:MAG: hydroxysqualene dehydroxylase HpnE [Rhodospirillales bacterium]|nr:hydroxysqualene dehydroxylase HpnE [Rhodospirillales bacterium]
MGRDEVTAAIHVVGAGVAGLAAAVDLARAGVPVTVYEAAGHAGGRCRSYFDGELGCRIDNGNHLLLSGNRSVIAYLAATGGGDGLAGPDRAEFPFVDLATGERWTVRPNSGWVPWWIFDPRRRVPGSRPSDYARGLKLAWAPAEATVAQTLGPNGAAFTRFWEPLAVGVLNTEADAAAAHLLWPVLNETFARGEAACRPRIAREGLSETFVDPALATLRRAGGRLRLHTRVQRLAIANERVVGLTFADGEDVSLRLGDLVIVAVPAAGAARLVPGLDAPTDARPIVNGHFRLPGALGGQRFIGVIGGLSQWIFVRGDVVSVTVSAARGAVEEPADDLLRRMWTEVADVLDLGAVSPVAARVVKEKRATFAQTPAQVARRPRCQTAFANLLLAGDWTDTGLPATIEGSVRSGNTAARQARRLIAAT